MRRILTAIIIVICIHARSQDTDLRYVIENDNDVMQNQPGPHKGGGETIGHTFFSNVTDYPTVFKKRILKPDSGIGYHMQEKDEIFYIVEGKGILKMNGVNIDVSRGDAILTRKGSSHGLWPNGEEDLVVIIVYEKD